jgi:quercetin dioxygenase-like cupin family protein
MALPGFNEPTENQLAADLPGPTTYLTGHNDAGQAILHSTRPVVWTKYDDDKMTMAVAYTTEFPADLNNDADVARHDSTDQRSLVAAGGTVLRYVDFAPGYECMMHRTKSLDYGIVVEGEIVSVLDSGQRVTMKRGDIMVQRATMHSWKNESDTEWARMVFVLQDCQPLMVGGQTMGEDLGRGTDGVEASGNDV